MQAIIIENYAKRRGSTTRVRWKSSCQKTILQCLIHQKNEAQSIIKKADPVIKEAASYIQQHLLFPEMSLHLKDKLQSSIVNTVFYPLFVKAAAFYSTGECIGCGLCETLCPLKNIQIKDCHPVWGKDCTHCMACIARCPKEAIEYGKKSKGKNRYYIE